MRISKTLKEEVIRKFYIDKLKKSDEKALQEFKDAFLKFANDFRAEEIAILEEHKNLKPYFEVKSYATLYFNENVSTFCELERGFVDTDYLSLSATPYVRRTNTWDANNHHMNKVKDKALNAAFKKWKQHLVKVEDEILSVKQVLNSVTTVKKLLDICPAFSEYIPQTSGGNTMPIPVDQIKKVEALLKG